MTASDKQNDLLRAKLNLETSRMRWKELLRYFAAGTVIAVSDELDLIDVAACISADDTASVAQWMSEKRVEKVSDAQAAAWLEADAALWAVVVKPWILVQHNRELDPSRH
ncbi:MAG: hypothetical protein A3I66_13925 [Burkholderiales bacterium RIFCSPLOWO2_02_FULL_57_36]|nr:MAG: hypothetical protein A3I66_13925 [Burkholderiales bacterium RIFCSPLOWO2_02_FULL_57_36]